MSTTITLACCCVIRNIWPSTPHPVDNQRCTTSSAMASRLAVHQASSSSSAAPLSRAETASPTGPNPRRQPPKPQPQNKPSTTTTTTTTGRSRRLATAAALVGAAAALLAPAASAGTFDLRITLPEESSEEAEAVVRAHARNLLRVKQFADAGAWRELQAALRSSASNLKQDLYAIIQARPAGERPELRRLYSQLFNSVTSLDYAARDKDEVHVQEYYGNIVSALKEIFDKIM